MKKPSTVCCDAPDVKNEGFVNTFEGRSWEYHCYACGKTWNEFQSNLDEEDGDARIS